MEIVSIGPVLGGPADLGREFEAVAQRLPGPRLGILYLPISADLPAYLHAAGRGLGSDVIGATTGGVAFTERGWSRDQAVGAVIGGSDFDYALAIVPELSRDPEAGIAAAMRTLVDAARRRVGRHPSLLTLADAFACDGEALVRALSAASPPHWRQFGGTAGDGFRFEQTSVFAKGEVWRDAAVLAGLFTDAAPSIVAHHGWCAVPDSREFTVTEIEGSHLRRLDDRPAVEVYREELLRLGLMRPGEDLLHAMAKNELGAKTSFNTELKVRAPLALDPDGSIRLAASLPHGTVVRVVTADAERLTAAARELSTRALTPLKHTIRGALVFDCAARLQLLGDDYADEVSAFAGGRTFPMVGMACYGEIAKYGGSVEGFHNTTAVMAAW